MTTPMQSPVSFRKALWAWHNIDHPQGMSDKTFQRILMQRAVIAYPHPINVNDAKYYGSLAIRITEQGYACKAHEVQEWLKRPILDRET
jgi:hypothetical protein